MTAKDVAAQLKELIGDPSNSVLALSGAWGTGKTYLWKTCVAPEIKLAKKPLYISLFGLKSITEIQAEIAQAASASDDPALQEKRRNQLSAATLALRFMDIAWLRDVMDVFTTLAIPKLIEGRVLVIDDIERKHTSLETEVILGFIDRYREVYGSRFLLILNRHQLEDKEMWAKYREKVIDHEVTLSPTADEAFEIAAEKISMPLLPEIKQACLALELTNIRILKRILRVSSAVLGALRSIPVELHAHVAPSLVLLPAIHFRAKDDLPTKEFVLGAGHLQKREGRTPQEERWSSLLVELGIIVPDDFEKHVLDYLDTGLLHPERFQAVLDGYVDSNRREGFENRLRETFRDIAWSQSKSNAQLCDELRGYLPDINRLQAPTVTAFSKEARELGDAALADELISAWIEAYERSARDRTVPDTDVGSYFNQEVDSRIKEAQARIKAVQSPPLPLVDAIKSMEHGWGDREVSSLRAATAESYLVTLKSLDGRELAYFLKKHFEWLAPAQNYEFMAGLSEAMPRFLEACKLIVAQTPHSRLAQILLVQFKARNISHLIE